MNGHKLLPGTPGATPVDQLVSRGQRRVASGDPRERARGITDLLDARARPGARDVDHERALSALVPALLAADLPRPAMACAIALGDERLVAGLGARVPPRDRATAAALGVGSGGAPRLREAAALWQEDDRVVSAARALERAEAWGEARALWSRLASRLDDGALSYESALAWLNVVRASIRLGDADAQRRAAELVVERAEIAADAARRADERERAVDALEILVLLGRHTRRFEHALPGYVGRARTLRRDRLVRFATATFAEAIAHARQAGDNAAAAELARELASLAQADGDDALARRARREEADSARMAAAETGRPDALVEPMLLAAARAYAELGAFSRVDVVYAELAARAPTQARRDYYARARARYEGLTDRPWPAPLGVEARPPPLDLFHVDLAEWEAGGSAAEAAVDLLLDPACTILTRRRALTVQLAGLLCEPGLDRVPEAGVALVSQVACLEVYAMLSPLERLSRSPHADVRAAVADALGRFRFKRALRVARALAVDPALAPRLAPSIERLAFAHGIDVLLELARSPDPHVAPAALRALAQISHPDAGEALLELLVEAGARAREVALSVLDAHPSAPLRSAARRALDSDDPTRRALAARLVGP
ncbi:MAG: hypothetical protein IT374_08610 [Polyangiaceae bacterium]|nr:hypothetical protein [Polyangiaceae bacterium]